MESNNLSRTDFLAIERTRLANERTFLAYFRTFIVVVSSGFAILKIEMFQSLANLGYAFIIVGFMLFLIGIGRFFYVRKQIRKFYGPM